MLTEAAGCTLHCSQDWDAAGKQYKAPLPEITSIDAWKKTFEDEHQRTGDIDDDPRLRATDHARGWAGDLGTFRPASFLLKLLVRKELKVRYRGSVLGLLWSYVKPAVQFLVFYVALGVFLDLEAAHGTRTA